MAITLATVARNAAADAVVDLIDGGTGAGYIQWMTSGDSVLGTSEFAATAFGAASNGVATAASISDVTATGTGTCEKFEVYDGDDTLIFSGTVTETGNGGDATFDETAFVTGGTIKVTSFTYTQPATPA